MIGETLVVALDATSEEQKQETNEEMGEKEGGKQLRLRE